ncbi:MAG: DUF1579 domain-containing protein [Gemmataceae bacterium]|nr:DUF1579 domain-containing protein [Gemmataceae bacterium]
MWQRANLVVISLLMIAPASGVAQPPGPAAQLVAMKKVHFLVGEWKGEGWFETAPGQKREFKGSEVVRLKAGGVVLTVEGEHRAKAGPSGEGPVVHSAFGIVTYDEKAKRYRFQGFTSRGNHEDTEAKVTDGQLVWEMKIPRFGDVRYTIKLDDKGRWFEIGEVTQDGKDWRQFFEMTLEKSATK